MGLLDGRVALVTGAGRGQGRSHARRLADVRDLDARQWRDVVDVNLTGVFHTVRAVVTLFVDAGNALRC